MSNRIKKWQLIFVLLSVLFYIFSVLSVSKDLALEYVKPYLHSVIVLTSFIFQITQVVWLFNVMRSKSKRERELFIKYSFLIWCIWLVGYLLYAYFFLFIYYA